jgi:hypothetical protein
VHPYKRPPGTGYNAMMVRPISKTWSRHGDLTSSRDVPKGNTLGGSPGAGQVRVRMLRED